MEDHRCLLMDPGKILPRGIGPTLSANERIIVAAVRTSGLKFCSGSQTSLNLLRDAGPLSAAAEQELLEAKLSVSSASNAAAMGSEFGAVWATSPSSINPLNRFWTFTAGHLKKVSSAHIGGHCLQFLHIASRIANALVPHARSLLAPIFGTNAIIQRPGTFVNFQIDRQRIQHVLMGLGVTNLIKWWLPANLDESPWCCWHCRRHCPT